ncbi:hypothetical protein GNI_151420 [Gregarina niphandrodes]|uniref:Uncharacterized protein n=1 Tax=Gregarina niphandrodes TaxID=110365 RepID=A0A023AZK1_GRENI|nr:hypothetical protein GNI_151420 [Gregarina niphandrodes]EZG44163.1 hypothetical protein GNI_151420 [Gregarina niphandrodes]|eukprot:XP_011132787.1 hypothetical protein GNI_151420 [Gregarina niphandrodes]
MGGSNTSESSAELLASIYVLNQSQRPCSVMEFLTIPNESSANELAANESAANESAATESAATELAANELAANESAANESAANESAANDSSMLLLMLSHLSKLDGSYGAAEATRLVGMLAGSTAAATVEQELTKIRVIRNLLPKTELAPLDVLGQFMNSRTTRIAAYAGECLYELQPFHREYIDQSLIARPDSAGMVAFYSYVKVPRSSLVVNYLSGDDHRLVEVWLQGLAYQDAIYPQKAATVHRVVLTSLWLLARFLQDSHPQPVLLQPLLRQAIALAIWHDDGSVRALAHAVVQEMIGRGNFHDEGRGAILKLIPMQADTSGADTSGADTSSDSMHEASEILARRFARLVEHSVFGFEACVVGGIEMLLTTRPNKCFPRHATTLRRLLSQAVSRYPQDVSAVVHHFTRRLLHDDNIRMLLKIQNQISLQRLVLLCSLITVEGVKYDEEVSNLVILFCEAQVQKLKNEKTRCRRRGPGVMGCDDIEDVEPCVRLLGCVDDMLSRNSPNRECTTLDLEEPTLAAAGKRLVRCKVEFVTEVLKQHKCPLSNFLISEICMQPVQLPASAAWRVTAEYLRKARNVPTSQLDKVVLGTLWSACADLKAGRLPAPELWTAYYDLLLDHLPVKLLQCSVPLCLTVSYVLLVRLLAYAHSRNESARSNDRLSRANEANQEHGFTTKDDGFATKDDTFATKDAVDSCQGFQEKCARVLAVAAMHPLDPVRAAAAMRIDCYEDLAWIIRTRQLNSGTGLGSNSWFQRCYWDLTTYKMKSPSSPTFYLVGPTPPLVVPASIQRLGQLEPLVRLLGCNATPEIQDQILTSLCDYFLTRIPSAHPSPNQAEPPPTLSSDETVLLSVHDLVQTLLQPNQQLNWTTRGRQLLSLVASAYQQNTIPLSLCENVKAQKVALSWGLL